MKIYFTEEGGAYIQTADETYLCIGKSEEVKEMTEEQVRQAIVEAVIIAQFNAMEINKHTTLH